MKFWLIVLFTLAALVGLYSWWFTDVSACREQGGVPVRGIGHGVVCLDMAAVRWH
jgi:hypothetical protein